MNEEFKGDYLGFSFNGKHSSDFGIVRTSSGSRFEQKMTPTMKDKTVDKPNNDGQYYVGTTHTKADISVPFAFDNMTEEQYQSFRRWVTDKNILRLVFDEDEKLKGYYMAKITGNATLKHLAFVEGGARIYKGDGSITFSCLNPYKMIDGVEAFDANNKIIEFNNDGVVDTLPIIKLNKPLRVGARLIVTQNALPIATLIIPGLDLARDETNLVIDCINGLVVGANSNFAYSNNVYNDYYDGAFPSFSKNATTSLALAFENSEEPVNATIEYTKFYL